LEICRVAVFVRIIGLTLLSGLLAACISAEGETLGPGRPTIFVDEVADEEATMDAGVEGGSVPDALREWYEEWLVYPLPSGALVRFQVVSRGPNPRFNYRWELYQDGRWFLARHSGDTNGSDAPFDTELPSRPTRQLTPDVVAEVLECLEAADFWAQPAYQSNRSVRNGAFYIVTARSGDEVHEVIYEAAYPPLVEFLDEFIYEYEEE
jgi:hypothetical protein